MIFSIVYKTVNQAWRFRSADENGRHKRTFEAAEQNTLNNAALATIDTSSQFFPRVRLVAAKDEKEKSAREAGGGGGRGSGDSGGSGGGEARNVRTRSQKRALS